MVVLEYVVEKRDPFDVCFGINSYSWMDMNRTTQR